MNKFFCFLAFCFIVLSTEVVVAATEEESYSLSDLDQVYSSTETYTIISKLGEGAFGEVFFVEDSKRQPFALKSYKKDFKFMNDFYVDAEREFMRGQVLNHSNIIKSLDQFIFELPSKYVTKNIVLELVQGKTLKSIDEGALSEKQALRSAVQLCEALRYAFASDLIHLDLHSGNLMLNGHLDIKVIDLASFFTFEELIEGFEDYEEKVGCEAFVGNGEILAKSKEQLAPPAQRLLQIFIDNPELLDALQKVKKAQKVNIGQKSLISHATDHQAALEQYRISVYHHYFTKITEMCFRIIKKSAPDESRLNEWNAAFGTFVLQYTQDMDAGVILPLEAYLDGFIEFLYGSIML